MNDIETLSRDSAKTLEQVRDYYGRVLAGSADLKTSACCTTEAMPRELIPIARQLHPEVTERFYGCGSPIPPALEGATVLDLGCGTGRDCYLLSKLIGEKGRVIGVDMTDEQLEVARRHRDYHTEVFGMRESNVDFRQGYIEDLKSLGIADASMDTVISNCVINLSPDKRAVFSEIFRVLKPGGELYFSDVFADRRVPAGLAADPVLLGECLGGAMYWEDFRRLLHDFGCADVRKASSTPIEVNDPELAEKTGNIRFRSVTVRAFKLDLEDRCEDYGQVAYYQGTIPNHRHRFVLDDHHALETNRPLPVCGNTADMLSRTRYAPHFRVEGDKSVHYGLFDCASPGAGEGEVPSGNACC